ncbi:MAG: penicillin-binding protein activator LpoB [Treponema sp.]|nr:penicillin-binding protein activator LpoB [Treponema sp.]
MKKIVMVLFVSFLTGVAVFAQQLPLKDVIKQTARELEGAIPQKTVIAIINFSSPTRDFSEHVIEELTNELLETGRLTLVDRRNLNRIREELNLSLSGDVSDESALSIGKMLGARFIISGTLTKMETYHRFRTKIVNVETGVIQRQITFDLQTDAQAASLLNIKRPTSNVRDNWISGELTGGYEMLGEGAMLGFGIRYERMLNSQIALGANVHLGIPLSPWSGVIEYADKFNMDAGIGFGIDAFFRIYPWARTFFVGIGLGYYKSSNGFWGGSLNDYAQVYNIGGLAITGEIGFKIDVGKEGGFYIQPGFLGSFIVGSLQETVYGTLPGYVSDKRNGTLGMDGYFRGYIGAGYAF